MAKKLLCIVLSMVMLASTFIVAAHAEEDYKKLIDTKFLHAYDLDENTFNETFATENLYFWKDEIITAYNSATTNAEYKTLYEKMCTPHTFVYSDGTEEVLDYWYVYRDESKATINIKYVADKTTVNPGDTVNIKVYVTTNFWVQQMTTGIIFDKQYVTASGYTYNEGADGATTWKSYSYKKDWGTVGTRDWRYMQWPVSMRDNNNGEYDKYEICRSTILADTDLGVGNYDPCKKFNNTFIDTYRFTVNEGTPAGTVLNFFCTPDAGASTDQYEFYMDNGQYTVFNFDRSPGAGSKVTATVDAMSIMDQTYSFENATVTVAGATEDPASYTALDAAIADYDALVASKAEYTTATWAAYESAATAAKAVSRDLLASEQATIDTATTSLTDAKAALAKNEIISAVPTGVAVLNSNANVDITVTGSPEKIRVMDADNNALTFTRSDAVITTSGANEIWRIKIYASSASATYNAFVSYNGSDYLSESKAFTITAEEGADLSIHSIYVPDMYPNGANGGSITSSRHNVVFTTSTDVYKIQLVYPDGGTCTYSVPQYNPVDEDGVRTWTVPFTFSPCGEISFTIRTRSIDTTFATADETLDARIVY